MISLIKKDLLIQKKSFLFLFIYGLLLFVLFNNPVFNNMTYIMGMIIGVYFLLITANMEDEKNRSEIVLNSLPVRRSHIVLAKYLSIFVYIFIAAAILGIEGLTFQLPAIPITPRLLKATDLLAVIFLISIAVSIYFPLYFRFGASALRLFSVIFFLFFFFLPRYLVEFYLTYEEAAVVQLINSLLLEQSPLVPAAIVIVFSLLLLYGSFLLSRNIYKRKEF